ncbi:hypothetical protein V1477_011341 [Vespula maculifrons]|uniref:Uncharacterized protein n=1 Tax=Vespula maculifrons TaxID=7453 RepID=A0ABD2C4I4_VESMC
MLNTLFIVRHKLPMLISADHSDVVDLKAILIIELDLFKVYLLGLEALLARSFNKDTHLAVIGFLWELLRMDDRCFAAKQTERKSTEKKIEKEKERKRGGKKKTKKWYRKKFAKPLSKEYTLFSLAGDLSETLSKWFTDHSNRRTFKIKDTWSLLEPSIYFKSYDLESGHNPCFPTFSYFSIHKYSRRVGTEFQGRLRRADLGIGQAEKQELRAKNEALARGYGKPIILTRDGGAKVVGRTWGVGVGTGESLKEEVLRELGIV